MVGWFRGALWVWCAIFLFSSCASQYPNNYKMKGQYQKMKTIEQRYKEDHARKNALIYFILVLTIGEIIVYDNRK